MNQTSLQNIISRSNLAIREAEVTKLFQIQQFPRFELHDLTSRPQLMHYPHFPMFLALLEEWNRLVAVKDQQLNECQYRKREFIFSWLKSIAVQNEKFVESSLRQLHQWYAASSQPQLKCSVRKENAAKSRLQEWEIRNSYKSNMPLQIDNYRRRVLFGSKNENVEIGEQESGKHTEKVQLKKIKSLQRLKIDWKEERKENNYLRGVREDSELTDFQKNYKRTKVNFYQNMAKNYFKKEFCRDKLTISQIKELREKFPSSDQLKSYRIKTSMGARPFQSSTPNSSFIQTSYSTFFRGRDTASDLSKTLSRFSPSPQNSRLNASNIDGLSLLANPFEVKLRKKRK